MSIDTFKRAAADQAASLVENNMVVGLGTGSTAAFLIETLIKRAAAGLQIKCIPTSERSAAQAKAGGLELVTFATNRTLDIAIDGADEIKRDTLDLVKGLGFSQADFETCLKNQELYDQVNATRDQAAAESSGVCSTMDSSFTASRRDVCSARSM